MLSSGRSSSTMYPFTPTQWQELEQQALIYKYMASGIPIPSDLLLPVRSSYFLNTTTTPTLLPHLPHPTMGWGCYQMGYGRKAADPEPGRCRRTDGKKWRCSKEAYTDSKYCERHMHRGKNRSRKPVEISLNNNNNNNNNNRAAAAAAASFSLPLSAHPYYSTRTTSEQRDHNNKLRYGTKDAVDECAFVSGASAGGGGGGGAWELRPLGLGEPKAKQSAAAAAAAAARDYSNGEEEEEEEKKHCFVLGADFKLGSAAKGEEERPLCRFFDEWAPEKSRRDPWMVAPKTQLSISIPMGPGLHPSHLINGSCE